MIKLQDLVTNGGVKPQLEDGDYAVCLALAAGALELKLVPTDGLPGGSALPSTQPNQVLAGPASGTSPAAASGRALVDADIPVEIARVSALAGYQPADSDLTAIAALATTSFGRSLLTAADAAALRALTGIEGSESVLGVAGSSSPTLTLAQRNVRLTTVLTDDRTITLPASAPDGHRIIISDPNGYALNSGGGFTRYIDPPAGESIDGQVGSFVFPAYALLELVKAGSDWRLFLAFPSTQQALARAQLGLGSAATQDAISFQAADSDLAAIAALTTTTFGRSLLTLADAAAARSALGLGTAATASSSSFAAASHTHAAADLVSGTIATARLGSGAASSGTYLRGDQTWAVLSVPSLPSTSAVLKGDGAGNAVAISNHTDTKVVQMVGDASATIGNTTDVVILTAAFTAVRTLTLPAASSFGSGRELWVVTNGYPTISNYLKFVRGGSDTYNGSTADTATNFQAASSTAYNTIYTFASDGVSKWFLKRAIGVDSNGNVTQFSGGTIVQIYDNFGVSQNIYVAGNAGLTADSILTFSNDNSSATYQVATGLGKAAQGLLEVNNGTLGQYRDLRVRSIFTSTKTPASASDTGTTGEIAWDSNYIYACVATNTWKRAALASW